MVYFVSLNDEAQTLCETLFSARVTHSKIIPYQREMGDRNRLNMKLKEATKDTSLKKVIGASIGCKRKRMKQVDILSSLRSIKPRTTKAKTTHVQKVDAAFQEVVSLISSDDEEDVKSSKCVSGLKSVHSPPSKSSYSKWATTSTKKQATSEVAHKCCTSEWQAITQRMKRLRKMQKIGRKSSKKQRSKSELTDAIKHRLLFALYHGGNRHSALWNAYKRLKEHKKGRITVKTVDQQVCNAPDGIESTVLKTMKRVLLNEEEILPDKYPGILKCDFSNTFRGYLLKLKRRSGPEAILTAMAWLLEKNVEWERSYEIKMLAQRYCDHPMETLIPPNKNHVWIKKNYNTIIGAWSSKKTLIKHGLLEKKVGGRCEIFKLTQKGILFVKMMHRLYGKPEANKPGANGQVVRGGDYNYQPSCHCKRRATLRQSKKGDSSPLSPPHPVSYPVASPPGSPQASPSARLGKPFSQQQLPREVSISSKSSHSLVAKIEAVMKLKEVNEISDDEYKSKIAKIKALI